MGEATASVSVNIQFHLSWLPYKMWKLKCFELGRTIYVQNCTFFLSFFFFSSLGKKNWNAICWIWMQAINEWGLQEQRWGRSPDHCKIKDFTLHFKNFPQASPHLNCFQFFISFLLWFLILNFFSIQMNLVGKRKHHWILNKK